MIINGNEMGYTKINLRNFVKYSIHKDKETVLQLDIHCEHTTDFEKFLDAQIESCKSSVELLRTVLRYIDISWLLPDKNFDFKRSIVSELFVSYFSGYGNAYGYSVDDSVFQRTLEYYKSSSDIQDEELLFDLANGIVFHDQTSQIRLNNINGKFFTLKREEYVRILDIVKKQFGINTSGIVDIDDLLQEAVDIFIGRILGHDDSEAHSVSEQAYLASDFIVFRDNIITLLDQGRKALNFKDVLQIKGYLIELKGSITNPILSLSPLSIISVYHGLPSVSQEYKKVLEFKGDEFWDLAWGELARKHEERLIEESQGMRMGAKCSDRFDATLGEIQSVLSTQYGIKLTESSLGQITKKALAKIKEEFKKRNISYEDYADFLQNE